jgi:hypothetical protein
LVRRLHIVVVIALALAGACVAGMVLTYRYRPVLLSEKRGQGFSMGVRLDDGRVFVSWSPAVERRPPWAGQVNRLHFRYTRWSDGSGEVGVPFWSIALLCATVGGAAGAAARVKRLRARQGRCRVCGYDLRASRARCPECETSIDDEAAGKPVR